MDSELIAQAIRLLKAAETRGDGPTVAEVWAKYAEWGPRNLRNWKTGQHIHWKHLEPFFGDRRVVQVGLADVDTYRTRRTAVKPATRNREMSSLRACFFWAVKRSLIARNPLAGMEQENEGAGRTEFIGDGTASATDEGWPPRGAHPVPVRVRRGHEARRDPGAPVGSR